MLVFFNLKTLKLFYYLIETGFDPSASQAAVTTLVAGAGAGTDTGTGTSTGTGTGTVTGTVSSESELIQKSFVQKCFRTGAGGGSGRKKRQTQYVTQIHYYTWF